MGRESYQSLNTHIQSTIIPNVIAQYGFEGVGMLQIKETIAWRFFDQIPKTVPNLLNAMQRLISETKFEKPFFETIELLSRERMVPSTDDALVTAFALKNNSVRMEDDGIMEHRMDTDQNAFNTISRALYVYSFQQTNAMDIRGKINYFGGAPHSADLLFLMGPSLFQQTSRRKLTQSEDKLCKKMRQYFSEFVKRGNPTPGRLYDAWKPYTRKQKYVQVLGNNLESSSETVAMLERNKIQIAEMLISPLDTTVSSNDIAINNPYNIGGIRKFDTSRTSKSYIPDNKDSEFFLEMSRVSSFWNELLPRIYKQQGVYGGYQLNNNNNNTSRQDIMYMENETSSKFKHAFFSMLILVCLLLSILCVCVYILRKNPRSINTSYL